MVLLSISISVPRFIAPGIPMPVLPAQCPYPEATPFVPKLLPMVLPMQVPFMNMKGFRISASVFFFQQSKVWFSKASSLIMQKTLLQPHGPWHTQITQDRDYLTFGLQSWSDTTREDRIVQIGVCRACTKFRLGIFLTSALGGGGGRAWIWETWSMFGGSY